MRNRMSSVCDQLMDFVTGIVNWLWDTFELIVDILLEFLVRGVELVIAVLHLAFQVVCFLRDLCIEALQTFAGIFRGFVNIVSSIKCEEVEDFATACIVVLLWAGAAKVAYSILDRRKKQSFPNPLSLLANSTGSSPGGGFPNPMKCSAKKNVNESSSSKPRRGAGSKRKTNSSITSSTSDSEDM